MGVGLSGLMWDRGSRRARTPAPPAPSTCFLELLLRLGSGLGGGCNPVGTCPLHTAFPKLGVTEVGQTIFRGPSPRPGSA